MEPMRHGLVRYVGVVFAVGIPAMFLISCQNAFVYHPTRAGEQALLEQAEQAGFTPWPQAGEDRIGWRAAPEPPAPDPQSSRDKEPARALVFHGNAGHSLHREYLARGLQSAERGPGWDVHLFEYPGYGSRDGTPGEETIMNAAAEALETLLAEDEQRPVYLVGESLGSGVAAALAARFPEHVPAVLLITPFTNLEDVGAAMVPRPLVRLILRDRYDAKAALETYDGRVGVLIAGEDEVVTPELGTRLYESYDGEKRKWVQQDASHNTLDYTPGSPFWDELTDFLLGH